MTIGGALIRDYGTGRIDRFARNLGLVFFGASKSL